MSDYIKREDALNAFRRVYMIPGQGTAKEIYTKQIENTYKQIESIPAADVVERELYQRALSDVVRLSVERPEQKHGEWKTVSVECFGGGTMTEYECSLCKERQIIMSNFCPNCGARMDGDNGT